MIVVMVALAVMVTAAVVAAKLLPSSIRYPRGRQVAQLLFPPGDLYTPLAEVPADLSGEGSAVEFEFEHRYPGAHEIVLDVPGPTSPGAMWPGMGEVAVEVKCGDSGGRQVGGEVRGGAPYWRDGGWGMSLVTYAVPDALGYRERIRCRIVTISGGAAFSHAFPRHQFVVKKASEK